MDFERTNLKIETLGEYLVSARNELGFSQAEFAKLCSVPLKYLSALEHGDMELAEVYVIGFLKQIAAALNISAQDLIMQYRKERKTQEKFTPKPKQKLKIRWYSSFSLTPKSLSVIVAALPLLVFGVYIYAQVVKLNRSPKLEIVNPTDNQVVNDFTLPISGVTDIGSTLFLNNQAIPVNGDGTFSTSINVQNGKQTLQFVSKNRFEKISEKNVTVLVNLPDVSITDMLEKASTSTTFSVTLQTKVKQTLHLTTDGTVTAIEFNDKQHQVTIDAVSDIILEPDKPDTIDMNYNNKKLGTLRGLFPEDSDIIYLDKKVLDTLSK